MCGDGKESIESIELINLDALIKQYTDEWFAASREADKQIHIAVELSMMISDLQEKRKKLITIPECNK